MRGPHYDKPNEKDGAITYEKQYVEPYEAMRHAAQRQHWEQHHKPSGLYHFIGKIVIKLVIWFILSFPLAWIGMKATPYNLQLMNWYCGKYLQYFVSFIPTDKPDKQDIGRMPSK